MSNEGVWSCRLHRLSEAAYRLGQLRYDLGKLRAHGLVERLGTSRRYRLTSVGLRLSGLLVELRTCLLGPLASLASEHASGHCCQSRTTSVETAFKQVDRALDKLRATLGLAPAA